MEGQARAEECLAMIFLNIAGGVALILFGTRFLRKGLDRLFGQSLVRWLQSLTENRFKAFGAGIVAGVGTPSSTAVSLVAVQMLASGQLSAERMLAVFLGANVGITAPAQLLAFHVQDYATAFLLVGVIGFQFLQRALFRGIGQCVLALGFLFLAMQLIGNATRAIEPTGELGLLLRMLAEHIWVVLGFSTVFAFLMQSSTAAIGLGIGLAAGGLFSPAAMLAWVLGANLGIAFTTLAAGWNSLEGRRLASANLLVKAVAAMGVMIALPLMHFGRSAPAELASQSVHFHTLFNLGVGLLCLPLVGPISHFMRHLIAPAPVTSLSVPETYLDAQALESPSLALANATRETLAMADEVEVMLHSFWQAQSGRDRTLAARVHDHDDRVDDTASRLIEYLSQISEEDLGASDSHWQFTLLSCANELESIADIIDKNLCDFVRKQAAHGFPMTSEDESALEQLYERIHSRCDLAFSLLTTRDEALATRFILGEETLEEWCRQAQRAHYERLRSGGERALQSSVYFLDMLGSFRRINAHLSSIAYGFTDGVALPETPPQVVARPIPTILSAPGTAHQPPPL